MITKAVRAFLKFNLGMMKMPVHWRIWLAVLVSANAAVPLFFLDRLEGQVVLGATMASMIFMIYLTHRFGFTRIVGLGHLFWIPMLAFLATRLGGLAWGEPFGIWIAAILVLDTLSLILDAADVIRYVAGDRLETVPGL